MKLQKDMMIMLLSMLEGLRSDFFQSFSIESCNGLFKIVERRRIVAVVAWA